MKSINAVSAGSKTRQAQLNSLTAGIFMPVENNHSGGKTVIYGGGYGVEVRNKRLITANTNPIQFDRREPAGIALIEAIAVTTNDGFINAIPEAVMLTISSKEIRESNGLYNLNDLHKAAGSEKKHEPYKFLRLVQTKELTEEIIKSTDACILDDKNPTSGVLEKIKGVKGGTFACKELVYAYAMWISPKFHLAVIRAFDQLQNNDDSQCLTACHPTPGTPKITTTITSFRDGQLIGSHTVDGLMMLIPAQALLEYDEASNKAWRAMLDAKAALVAAVITAKSTMKDTPALQTTGKTQ
ncbi:MAG: KilA-N domain-containing protein [Thiolinea sp.]